MIKSVKEKIIREGYMFKHKLNFLNESQYYSKQEMKNYQDENLRYIINHAYKNVPYYKEKFDDIKLHPGDIKSQNDLWKIPILTKDDIKKNFQRLKSTKHPRQILNLGNTSGTTGTPLSMYRDINSIIFENAIVWRQWNWAGLEIGDTIAVLRGERIIEPNSNVKEFWKYDKISKKLKLSPIHITDQNIPKYLDIINEYDCKSLQAYPSNAYALAIYMLNNNIVLNLNSVLTSSEPLYSFQREAIEKAFSCKVWDFYGMAERVVSASECSVHNGLHINEEYGITEFLDNGEFNNNKGIVVGTTLHNYGMPLIRYRTGDLAEVKQGICECGIEHRMIYPIETKSEDMITTGDGKYISASTVTHVFKPLTNIKESQIIQHDSYNYEIKIVQDGEFDKDNKLLLESRMKELVGDSSTIHVNLVENIERTNSGKFRWLISKVNKGD